MTLFDLFLNNSTHISDLVLIFYTFDLQNDLIEHNACFSLSLIIQLSCPETDYFVQPWSDAAYKL